MCTYTYTYVHIHMYIYIHTQIHTHTHSVVLGGVGDGVSAGECQVSTLHRQVLTLTVLLISRGVGLRLGVRLSICSEFRVRDWVSSTHFDGVSISGLDHNWY